MFWTTHDDLFVQPEIDRRRAPFTGHQYEFRRQLRRTITEEHAQPAPAREAIVVRVGRVIAGVGRSVRSAWAAV